MAQMTGFEDPLEAPMFGYSSIENPTFLPPPSDISCLNPASLDLSHTNHDYEQVAELPPFEHMYSCGPNTLFPSEKQHDQWLGMDFEEQLNSPDNTDEQLDHVIPTRRSTPEPLPGGARSQRTRQGKPEEEWNRMRPFIESLYRQKGNTLPATMKVMRDEHDFKASQTAYKKHFKDWGWAKKVPKDVANYMRIEARRREEEEGKATRYRFHGFEIPAHRFKRGAADGSETVISKPPCLSIETPDDSLKKRRSQVYHIDDSTIAHIASENAARRTIVEVHQGVQDVFKAQNIVENPTSTDERLEAYAFGQKVLIDEFSSMPVAHLCELLAGYVNRGYYCGTDLILENILIQSEEIHNTDNDLVLDTAQHEVLMVRNLVLQHKFWTASKVIDGILGKKDFEGSLPRYRLQIHKLALLVAVDERKREPRDLDQVESRCIVLIAEEVATLPTTNRYWAINLILVYLYRLHGINGKALREPSVARMQEVLKTQFSLESPSRSFIWVAQQYVHWCLRRMQYEEALGTLKGIEGILRMVCGPESLEAAQNARLQELYDRSRYKPNALTVEDIYLYNPLDKQCLDALRGYLRDEPRLTAEERYTKEMDEDYLF